MDNILVVWIVFLTIVIVGLIAYIITNLLTPTKKKHYTPDEPVEKLRTPINIDPIEYAKWVEKVKKCGPLSLNKTKKWPEIWRDPHNGRIYEINPDYQLLAPVEPKYDPTFAHEWIRKDKMLELINKDYDQWFPNPDRAILTETDAASIRILKLGEIYRDLCKSVSDEPNKSKPK